MPDPVHRVGVHPQMVKRGQGAVGGAHPQRPVTGPGQAHRRMNDALQRGIEIQIRTDLNDQP